ncbi:transmembrane protein 94 isoform X2 [Condylostylus longicornis]|uniref:transmembrane protein 94 isoform X2 n=1 Tax=Condylostylus longicornis TaxID=2530218 RepID=UPI00244E56CC|nr:transmembrane protein 94 isoform X2 [Condylostylus longicornis]
MKCRTILNSEMSSNNRNSGNLHGLSTKAALVRIREEIVNVLTIYENKFNSESILCKIRSCFVSQYNSPLGWFSILSTLFAIVGLLVADYYFSALIIFVILTLNIYIVVRENNLRRTEIIRKAKLILEEIKVAEELCYDWKFFNYPHLFCPVSPCVTLQWTYRDGEIINLPSALLVKGDHIVLRPGHTAPGSCYEILTNKKFKTNEIYGIAQVPEPPSKPAARPPLPDLICCLENTPYLDNLKYILENALKRPPTIYNQQRYLLVTKYIQQWGFIATLLITIFASIMRYYGLAWKSDISHYLWKEIFLESCIAAILPLLPLIFPIMWISLNLWGVARLETFLCLPQHPSLKDEEKSFEEDLDTPTYDYGHISLKRSIVFKNWLNLWQGSCTLLPRSANVVQVLGSITALCCVDKKGILSWPNPTAEKVFFLRDVEDKNSTTSQTSLESETTNNNATKKTGIISEVLDLTHDQHCPFKLEFDDHEWKNHITSLKPLGLAILLNTCSPQTHKHYAQFCGHVTAVATLDKDLVPVTNRRCLCELAKQIGFKQHATDNFTLEGQLATYRHLQPDVVRRDIKFARHLQLSSKVKVPFPHSLSVVLRESPGNCLSLFTQGTADIVLDCCDDFWDGKDLRPLGPQERKRAQDFYQRSALTAYCTAFAYRPLRHGICGALSGSHSGPIAYLELPPETKCKMQHVDKSHCDFEGHTKISHSISTDSLLFSESKDEDIADVEGCFEMQCHQVFIGMITMQYQAQTDIVQLVERLERACIRFVHFSKENELRSRVFSEKMGLESGWNCHISLLSEDQHSNPQSPKTSGQIDFSGTNLGSTENDKIDPEINCLLQPMGLESSKTLSSSAPGDFLNINSGSVESIISVGEPRHSQDSALDENCRSISILTDSTEQSAPINFDMSNRAKLPRGIENIRPHLEKVDNVPLQVSLFTDCSAEATKEMLSIMQSYGEIVVCLGSSASNSNSEIFLQADCSIAVEPLYPQVCQDVPAYTESNIYNNKLKHINKTSNKKDFTLHFLESYGTTDSNNDAANNINSPYAKLMHTRNNTISPIYLSRMLNSLPCSISVVRDDPLSVVAIIELSRRFSLGLWNCIQYWACCAGTLASLNILSACLNLPPIFDPFVLIYLMCFAVPFISLSLTHIQVDPKVMNRATGKKQTKFDSRVFGFVLWCYGCKFFPAVLVVIISYTTMIGHPLEIIDIQEENLEINLKLARIFALLGIISHFVIISASFVHRDHSIWHKNPFTNKIWTFNCILILIIHSSACIIQIISINKAIYDQIYKFWAVIVFMFTAVAISFLVTEFIKWQEIKVNLRYQRRARLDFGTKLGMNSPF